MAPDTAFVVGCAEDLPFADRTFDLVAAAGALNSVDCGRFLPAAARVLTIRGSLVIYDFSTGRRMAGESRLDAWFASFESRYPFPSAGALDVRAMDFAGAGLQLEHYEELEVGVPLTATSYLAYVLSETNVEVAISEGVLESDVRRWCEPALGALFGGGSRDVLFEAYIACVGHAVRAC